MGDADEITFQTITDLRKVGRPVEALRRLCEAAFSQPRPDLLASEFFGPPATPLSGPGRPCLLLEAARHRAGTSAADDPGFVEWFNSEVRSTRWSKVFLDFFGPADGPNTWKHLAALRRDLALLVHSPAADRDIEKSLNRIIRDYEAAFTLPQGLFWPASTSEPTWLAKPLPDEWITALRSCAQTTTWSSPALHFVGQTLLYLLGHDLPAATGIAETRVLGVDDVQQDGFIINLVVEAVKNGTGVVIPHPLYAGYLPTDETFRHALLRAIAAIHIDLPEPSCDYRWTLWITEIDGQGKTDRPAFAGDSAGTAFYCAMRAATTGEPLDDQAVITAALTDSTKLAPVGGLDLKVIATRDATHLKNSLVRRLLVSSTQEWHGQPLPASGHTINVDQWKLTLEPSQDRQTAYESLTEYGKIVKAIKAALFQRSNDILDGPEGLCRPYIQPTLSKAVKATDERGMPVVKQRRLSRESTSMKLLARFQKRGARVRILADSGLGKSTLLVAAEFAISQLPDLRIPIRLGAGPRSTQPEKSGRQVPINRLCDIAWDQSLAVVLIQIAKALHDIVPSADRARMPAFLQQAVERGDAVFLLDAIDQTRKDIPLSSFLSEIPDCTVIVTGRPETLLTKGESYRSIVWTADYRLEPLQRKRRDIQTYCEVDPRDQGLARTLLENKEWHDLIFIPVLLKQLRDLHRRGLLVSLTNRDAVYHATLHMLLGKARQVAPDAGMDHLAKKTPAWIESQLAEAAWDMLRIADESEADFTGQLEGDDLQRFEDKWGSFLDDLKTLNLTAHDTYLDPFGHEIAVIAWRHLSFGEWFAGLHLATLDEKRQREFFEKHSCSPDRGWVIAFAMSAADRLMKPEVLERMARWLIEFGNPFHLRTTLDGQKLTISKELNGLCNWLVHRDSEFREVEAKRPVVDGQIAAVLDTMFALDKEHLPKHRDSRWLHAAWELVRDTALATGTVAFHSVKDRPFSEKKATQKRSPQLICQDVHDRFLNEFETRLNQYAPLRSDKDREVWRDKNRGLIQLVPEECREALGFRLANLDAIRVWPAASSSPLPPAEGPGPGVWVEYPDDAQARSERYAQRRDEFNQRLKDHHVNWCLCPPRGWEHPHGREANQCLIGVKDSTSEYESKWDDWRLTPDYYLQRTPITNIQFEAMDPDHRSFRQMQDNESKETALDDHPVVEITWFQAQMLAIWLTGKNQTFGKFALPDEKDWEACCRAGRDAEGEISGVPWFDAQGREHFDVMTSQQANCDGNHPFPSDRSDLTGPDYPYKEGTVPVGQYLANGFGLVDMQGQVWEWQQTPWDKPDSPDESSENNRTVRRVVRGGSWNFYARISRSSYRYRSVAELRYSYMGFRLSRTS